VPLILPFRFRGVLKPRFYASHCSANIVIGDIFEAGTQQIVDAINELPPDNGRACWRRCDVTSWQDQVALFELAMTRFGGIDIVVSVHLFLVCIVEWY